MGRVLLFAHTNIQIPLYRRSALPRSGCLGFFIRQIQHRTSPFIYRFDGGVFRDEFTKIPASCELRPTVWEEKFEI